MAHPESAEILPTPARTAGRPALTFGYIGARTLELLSMDGGIDRYTSWTLALAKDDDDQRRLVHKIRGANLASVDTVASQQLEATVARLFAGNLSHVLGFVFMVEDHSRVPQEELIIDSNHLAADWFKRTYIHPDSLDELPEVPTVPCCVDYLQPILVDYSKGKIKHLPFEPPLSNPKAAQTKTASVPDTWQPDEQDTEPDDERPVFHGPQTIERRRTIIPLLTGDRSWMSRATCLGARVNEFFPSNGLGVEQAQRICKGCPVRVECLEYALENHIDQGVWGGASERERRRILRQRRSITAELQ